MNQPCCPEFEAATHPSRRSVLQTGGAAAALGVSTSIFGQTVVQASAAEPSGRRFGGNNVLVVLSLRGGMDGLGMVVPHGDQGYYKARPTVAIPKSSLLARDAMFGLHPKLAPLGWLWSARQMAVVHAVGLPMPNYSHFSAIEEIEDAAAGSSQRQGWINRMVGLESNAPTTRAVGLNAPVPSAALSGPAATISTRRLLDLRIDGRRLGTMDRLWDGQGGVLGEAYREARRAVGQTGRVAGERRTSVPYPTAYPAGELGAALKDTVHLIKGNVGAQIVTVDLGGWDLHSDYGTLDSGRMHVMVSGLAQALNAFMRDLGDDRRRVTVATISEFGRRVHENGSAGLDHGWGGAMLLMGAGVRGGRYYGRWPGLISGGKTVDDLSVTTDYRQVFGEIINKRFPSKDVSRVFPGLRYNPLGVIEG